MSVIVASHIGVFARWPFSYRSAPHFGRRIFGHGFRRRTDFRVHPCHLNTRQDNTVLSHHQRKPQPIYRDFWLSRSRKWLASAHPERREVLA